MDDVLADFSYGCEQHFKSKKKGGFPKGKVGFFENLLPIDGAIEAVNKFREQKDIDVYILTAPSTRNPHSYSEKRIWVENYFDYQFTKNLIICANKSLLKGDILIDENISGKGQENFEGELIHFSSDKYPNWSSVMEYLEIKIFIG